MGKTALIVIGGGLLAASMANAAFSGTLGVFVAYFASLPLFLVGLSLGANALGLAAAWGIVICALSGGLAGAAVFTALNALPSWLVTRLATRHAMIASGHRGWPPIGRVLALLTCLVAFTMTAVGVMTAGGDDLDVAVRTHLTEVFAASLSSLDDAARGDLVATVAPLFLGFSAAIWLLMIALNGVLAENLLAGRGQALRPRPTWSALALPEWFAWPLVAAAVVGLLASGDAAFLGRNIVLVFGAAYLLQGLAAIHTMLSGRRAKRQMLALLYLMLGMFFIFAAPVIAGVGMVDQWAGLRPSPPEPPQLKE
ncbi:MAG: DUF2232 domain-containing protein [Rhodospirillales bacterium]